MVSSHLDDHYHSLSLTTDSLSGIAFTIVLLDLMVEIVGLITESNDDNCFSEVLDSGGRLTAQWVSE